MNNRDFFKAYLENRNKSSDTVKRYMDTIRDFERVVGVKKEYTQVDVEKFLATLRQRGQAGGAYLRYNFYALKSFFRANKWSWTFQKEDVPKLDEPTQLWYTLEEMMAILEAAKKASPRDWLILRVLTLTMGRRKSASMLKRSDYDPHLGTITLPSIKRGRTPVVELDPETNKAMLKYLAARTDVYPSLFPSYRPRNKQGQMSLNYLNTMLRQYADKARVPRKGLHAFRRGMVTYFYELGYREKEIYQMGDWKSEAMVSRYVRLSPKFASQERKKSHPFFAREVRTQRSITTDEEFERFVNMPDKEFNAMQKKRNEREIAEQTGVLEE